MKGGVKQLSLLKQIKKNLLNYGLFMNAQELIYKLIEKAVILTADAMSLSTSDNIEDINKLISHRDHILNIFSNTYERLEKNLNQEYKNQLNQLIVQIMDMDQLILENLEKQKEKVQIDIAKIFKNRENFKGYNLNTLK